ncbi:MAG: oligoendopeptidase [Clostridiales bacterium]|nr:oligoendopeptidase [Clostridiales bacterium]
MVVIHNFLRGYIGRSLAAAADADNIIQDAVIWNSRADVPEKYKWRLEDIFAGDEIWEESLKSLEPIVDQLEACKGMLADSSAILLKALELDTSLDMILSELVAYARMRRDENNAQARYQDMTDRAMSLYYQIAGRTSFLLPEIAAIPEAELLAAIEEQPDLKVYRHRLINQIRQRPHILSESEEKLLSAFGNVSQGIEDIHTMLDNVDIDLGSIEDEDGSQIKLTMARFAQLRDNPSRHLRSEAFRQVHASYAALGNTLAALYSTQIRSDYMFSSARKFDSTIEASLFSDNLPLSLYENLLEAVHEAQPVLNKYLELRRQVLELDELHIYDTYLPIVKMPERRYTYEQACDIVRAAFAPLGEEYCALVDKHLTDRWIDVYETPGKTSGAFSWGTYKSHPYVLLNYSGTLSDVFTLAHELGHSLHTLFSSRRPFPQAHYPIFLAEIASTVNENLLINYLLEQCDENTQDGRIEKTWLLNHQLEGFRLTVFRQTMFAEFEQKAHAMSQAGETLNAETLNRLYGDLLREYFGPDTVIDEYMHWEWSRIPHFYNSFYVYKYATGFSSAVAIADMILKDGSDYVEKYLRFLSAGGSDYPLDILMQAGVNLREAAPLKSAMAVFADTLNQMQQLLSRYGT